MKLRFAIITLVLSMGLVACINNSSDTSNSDPIEGNDDDDAEEELEDAPVKSELFYQHLLESFCRQYYSDCFSGRTYSSNSLVVNYVNPTGGQKEGERYVSWNVMVKGCHSFEGMRKHNDRTFEAFIDELGDNSYKVSFYTRKYDLFGDETEDKMSATRVMDFYE